MFCTRTATQLIEISILIVIVIAMVIVVVIVLGIVVVIVEVISILIVLINPHTPYLPSPEASPLAAARKGCCLGFRV